MVFLGLVVFGVCSLMLGLPAWFTFLWGWCNTSLVFLGWFWWWVWVFSGSVDFPWVLGGFDWLGVGCCVG